MPGESGCRELDPRECYLLLTKNEGRPWSLIDVRTAEEYHRGHLEGAENIDLHSPDFISRIGGNDRTLRYIVYCRRGIRGHKAMELMRDSGYEDVINIGGGIENWISHGLPVEKHG
jgi:rhodanese-related sulfurtransferase